MIVHEYDFNQRATVPVQVPDQPIAQFIQWLLANGAWKHTPELLFERALKLRKTLLEAKRPYEPEPESVEPEPADPVLE